MNFYEDDSEDSYHGGCKCCVQCTLEKRAFAYREATGNPEGPIILDDVGGAETVLGTVDINEIVRLRWVFPENETIPQGNFAAEITFTFTDEDTLLVIQTVTYTLGFDGVVYQVVVVTSEGGQPNPITPTYVEPLIQNDYDLEFEINVSLFPQHRIKIQSDAKILDDRYTDCEHTATVIFSQRCTPNVWLTNGGNPGDSGYALKYWTNPLDVDAPPNLTIDSSQQRTGTPDECVFNFKPFFDCLPDGTKTVHMSFQTFEPTLYKIDQIWYFYPTTGDINNLQFYQGNIGQDSIIVNITENAPRGYGTGNYQLGGQFQVAVKFLDPQFNLDSGFPVIVNALAWYDVDGNTQRTVQQDTNSQYQAQLVVSNTYYAVPPLQNNFLPYNACINAAIPKVGENVTLSYESDANLLANSVGPFIVPDDPANNLQINSTPIKRSGCFIQRTTWNNKLHMQRGDGDDWLVTYMPCYFKKGAAQARIRYVTSYKQLNQGQQPFSGTYTGLAGSPNSVKWTLCTSTGTISSPLNRTYAINSSPNTNTQDMIALNSEMANLEGLYYVKIWWTGPYLSEQLAPRVVEFTQLTPALPVGWRIRSATITSEQVGVGIIDPPQLVIGSGNQGNEYIYRAVLPNIAPYDYGRSVVLWLAGQVGLQDFNFNQDLNNQTDWQAKACHYDNANTVSGCAGIGIPYTCFNHATNTVTFRMRRNNTYTVIHKLTYLASS